MTARRRSVFYVSDHTALTAETLGRSLVAQFPGIRWSQRALPYISDRTGALSAVQQIDASADEDGCSPLVIHTLLNPDLKAILVRSRAHVLDVFNAFLPGLEAELGLPASTVVGAQSISSNPDDYSNRIEAIQYSMEHDDGCNPDCFHLADIVLLGVSRTGKTPTSLYIATQFGLRAANYPLTETELHSQQLPEDIAALRGRLFGLTIEADKLSAIRNQRWPNSGYADPANCRQEISELMEIYRRYDIPALDVTRLSIEEVAARALEQLNINRTAKF